MQREIKFRAWDKKLNVMIPLTSNEICQEYSGIIFAAPEGHKYSGIGRLPGSYDDLPDGESFDARYELLQYTGLKDKTGKEIYESDIVKVFHGTKRERTDVIIWGQAGFALKEAPSGSIFGGEQIEVIGNIYENQELTP